MRTLAGPCLVALATSCGAPSEKARDSGASSPDGATNLTWSEAAPCPVPRFEAMAAVVGGEVWIMGGFLSSALDVSTRIDIYDPKRDAWRLGPELPGAQTHAGVANVGDDVVLAGGFLGNVLDRVTTADVWRWRAGDASFSAGPALPAPRAGVAMALVGTEIHVAGGLAEDGETDSGAHVVWDLAGPSAWTRAAPLANARNHGGGAAAGGLFYAVAGRHGWDEIRGDDPALDAFEPKTGVWQTRAPMPLERSEIGAATLVLPDGRLLVIGGSVPGKLPSADVLVYDPKSDAWSASSPLPEPRKGAAAALVGSKVVVTTGSPTSTDPSATTYVGCCL